MTRRLEVCSFASFTDGKTRIHLKLDVTSEQKRIALRGVLCSLNEAAKTMGVPFASLLKPEERKYLAKALAKHQEPSKEEATATRPARLESDHAI